MKTSLASSAASRAAFRRALAGWFDRHGRPLPWRSPRSLYRTLVSELMLQQTQVATVVPYFERWMQALPDLAALAAADEDLVLKLWEGLGYYRRARLLQRCARELVALGAPPTTAAGWRELPGVGPYTAAAIASLAFGDPAAVVDGNVVRVLARLTGEARTFADGAAAVKQFTPLAGRLLDPATPGRHNEAMMELGARVCVRRSPRCTECPVRRWCAAAAAGTAGDIPRIGRRAAERRDVDRVWIVRRGALLMHRAPDDAARMNGLHELPTAEQAGIDVATRSAGSLLATHRRAIANHRIAERIYRAAPGRRLRKNPAAARLVWVPLARIDEIALSGPHRRWIAALLASGPRARVQPRP